MLALGYPAEAPASRPRKKLEEIVAYDDGGAGTLGSPFFLGRLGLISKRDDVQKFFGKKTKKSPIIGATQKLIKTRNLNEIKITFNYIIYSIRIFNFI